MSGRHIHITHTKLVDLYNKLDVVKMKEMESETERLNAGPGSKAGAYVHIFHRHPQRIKGRRTKRRSEMKLNETDGKK